MTRQITFAFEESRPVLGPEHRAGGIASMSQTVPKCPEIKKRLNGAARLRLTRQNKPNQSHSKPPRHPRWRLGNAEMQRHATRCGAHWATKQSQRGEPKGGGIPIDNPGQPDVQLEYRERLTPVDSRHT